MFGLGRKKQTSPGTYPNPGALYFFTPRNGQSPGIGTSNRAFSTTWMDPCMSLLGTALPIREVINVLQPPPVSVWQVAPYVATMGAPLGGVPTGQLFTQSLVITTPGHV